MATFKMYECDFGFTYDGVQYDFDHVESVVIEDPERTRLLRGANIKNKTGLIYTEGAKQPKVMTVTIIGVSAAINALMVQIFNDKARCEPNVISRVDGSQIVGKNAVISQRPRQLNVDESPESMNVQIIFETFDLEEVHKDTE